KTFAAKYQGKVGKLSGQQLGEAIEAYEKICQLEVRVQVYADLSRAIDSEKGGWSLDVADKLREASEKTLFFTLEINNMREGDLFEKISAPKLAHYGPWIAKTRLFRDHQLSEEVEKYRRQMDPVTEEAWRRLYDQLMIDLRFKVGGKE